MRNDNCARSGWVRDVRRGSANVKILPRLLFEGWSASTLLALFRHEENLQSAVETVVDFLKVCTYICIYYVFLMELNVCAHAHMLV